MKIFLLLFCLAASSAFADDNLLHNGDFSNGISHWEGDCRAPDNGSADLAAAPTSNSSGVVVKLDHQKWTKISQAFEGRTGDYTLTINYTISNDLQFSRDPDDYTNLSPKIQYSFFGSRFKCPSGNWVIILMDLGMKSSSIIPLSPSLNSSSGTLSVTQSLHLFTNNNHGLCIAFPPGVGVLTFQSITLSP